MRWEVGRVVPPQVLFPFSIIHGPIQTMPDEAPDHMLVLQTEAGAWAYPLPSREVAFRGWDAVAVAVRRLLEMAGA
jgi:hypothetical protein